MIARRPTCILNDSLAPIGVGRAPILYFNMIASSRFSTHICVLKPILYFNMGGLKPMPYLKYEASVLNQDPNQVHGTEMNRGLLATKNSLCARPNTSTTEPRPESRGRCVVQNGVQ